MATPLSQEALQAQLLKLNSQAKSPWQLHEGALHKKFSFPSFVAAFGFMSQAALIAEKMDHHPDWSNSYNKVVVNLITHEVGAITMKDFALAAAMEACG